MRKLTLNEWIFIFGIIGVVCTGMYNSSKERDNERAALEAKVKAAGVVNEAPKGALPDSIKYATHPLKIDNVYSEVIKGIGVLSVVTNNEGLHCTIFEGRTTTMTCK